MLGQGPIAGVALVALPGGPVTFVMPADTGTFTVSGKAVTFQVQQAENTGVFNVTGNALTFRVSVTLSVGAFVLNGQAAVMQVQLACQTGVFTLAQGGETKLVGNTAGGWSPPKSHPAGDPNLGRRAENAAKEEREAKDKRDRDIKAKQAAAKREREKKAAAKAEAERKRLEEERKNFPFPPPSIGTEIPVHEVLRTLGLLPPEQPGFEHPFALPLPDFAPILHEMRQDQQSASDESDALAAIAALEDDQDILAALSVLQAAEEAMTYTR